jgi:hypothetical protein
VSPPRRSASLYTADKRDDLFLPVTSTNLKSSTSQHISLAERRNKSQQYSYNTYQFPMVISKRREN